MYNGSSRRMDLMSLIFQPMTESRPIREIAYDVLKKAIITVYFP